MYDTFTELGVKPEILKAVEDMGFEEPTPIQKAAIPTALTGKDLIGHRPVPARRLLLAFRS